MSTVILSPTWKLIPDSVSWPEKSAFTYPDGFFDEVEYDIAIKNASRHLVDIAEEDWEEVTFLVVNRSPESKLIRGKNDITFRAKQDTVYSIDAEFEVGEQYRNTVFKDAEWHDYDPELNGPKDAEPGEFEYRQIARLVKPKEHDFAKNPKEYTYFPMIPDHQYTQEDADQLKAMLKKYTDPTDSVTSDGTKEERAKDYVPDWENSKIIYATDQTGEKRLFINGEEWIRKPQPTESQDELWRVLDTKYVKMTAWNDPILDISEAKKRFRIERI